jgi:hypothetical protein
VPVSFWLASLPFNIWCHAGATKTLRLSTGYKTPYLKEIDEYDMQKSMRCRTVDLVENLLFVGSGHSSEMW